MNQKKCCCTDTSPERIPGTGAAWVIDSISTLSGQVNRVATTWIREDYVGAIKCRFSGFRMKYTVEPGLYATGTPTDTSPVFVSANYKLSFDHLRRALTDIDGWILVLDTRGINVWCAAGKGTFGTEELIRRITLCRLSERITGRTMIVPQLGAPGVAAHKVKESTGFTVTYGPVRARDINRFLNNNNKADAAMRQVSFPFIDRLILTPMELIPTLGLFLLVTITGGIVLGIEKEGILFRSIYINALPLFIAGAISLFTGTVLTPALLPYVPFRAFSVKGFITGCIAMALYIPVSTLYHPLLLAATILFFPAYSSFLTLNFTGSTPFTGITGVKKEMKYAVPVYVTVTGVTVVLLIIYKIHALAAGALF